jgi:methionyl aminopeptidase
MNTEHTLLVTADGVEILTARTADSPGGPVSLPAITNGQTNAQENGAVAA